MNKQIIIRKRTGVQYHLFGCGGYGRLIGSARYRNNHYIPDVKVTGTFGTPAI